MQTKPTLQNHYKLHDARDRPPGQVMASRCLGGGGAPVHVSLGLKLGGEGAVHVSRAAGASAVSTSVSPLYPFNTLLRIIAGGMANWANQGVELSHLCLEFCTF